MSKTSFIIPFINEVKYFFMFMVLLKFLVNCLFKTILNLAWFCGVDMPFKHSLLKGEIQCNVCVSGVHAPKQNALLLVSGTVCLDHTTLHPSCSCVYVTLG